MAEIMPIKKRSIKGLLYGLAGELSFSLTTPMLKILLINNPQLSPFAIIYWRSISNIIMNFVFCVLNGSHVLDFPKEYRGLMVFRMVIGYMGVQGIWASNKYMPISMAMCIVMTMPVWVALVAHFYLGERMNKL